MGGLEWKMWVGCCDHIQNADTCFLHLLHDRGYWRGFERGQIACLYLPLTYLVNHYFDFSYLYGGSWGIFLWWINWAWKFK